jgi:tetratricopeptide (TPR) repeat protein
LTLLQLANLGLAYWLQGDKKLASSTLKKGLQDREERFGKEECVSFVTGRFLHAMGNVESSLDYHCRALIHYKLTLGSRHHRTADVFVKVAEHHIRLGNYDMALALLNRALGAFSMSHTYISGKMRACWMRSKALSALGKKEEADSELANCYQVYVTLRNKREGDEQKIKDRPSELDDEDIDDLIVFWSK